MENRRFAAESVREVLKEAPAISREWGVSALAYQDQSEACCQSLLQGKNALVQGLEGGGFTRAEESVDITGEPTNATYHRLDGLPGKCAVFSVREGGADAREVGIAIRRLEGVAWKAVAYAPVNGSSGPRLVFLSTNKGQPKRSAWQGEVALDKTTDLQALAMMIAGGHVSKPGSWVRVHNGGTCLVFCPVPHSNMQADEFVLVMGQKTPESTKRVEPTEPMGQEGSESTKRLGPTGTLFGKQSAATGQACAPPRLPFFDSIASTDAGPARNRGAIMDQERRVLEIMARQRQGWVHRNAGR